MRSGNDGMKASSQSKDGSLSAHSREFKIWVCKIASFGAYFHEINKQTIHMNNKNAMWNNE